MKKSQKEAVPCPCGGPGFAACCGRFIGLPAAVSGSPDGGPTAGQADGSKDGLSGGSKTGPTTVQPGAGGAALAHRKVGLPESALSLMRSRYSAFTLCDADYLMATWHPTTRPKDGISSGLEQRKWLGLEILGHSEAEDGKSATVEFVARFKVGGRAVRLHEVSRFVREYDPTDRLCNLEGGAALPRWYYVDASFLEREKHDS